MFAVVGATGHTGKAVAEKLQAGGKKFRVLVHSAQKAEPWKAKGSEAAVVSLEDSATLARALSGVEGAYVLLPPDPKSQDFIGRGRRLVQSIAEALKTTPVPHVVLLSSIGAQHAEGLGPVRTLHHAEKELVHLGGTRFTFLRAAYFMENLLGYLPSMKNDGVLPVFGGGESYPFPMVAVQDIGEAAARALLEPPKATQIIELAGPKEYSLNDAARIFGAALSRQVATKVLPMDALMPAMMQMGMSEPMAGLYREMMEGMGKGLLAWEGKNARGLRGTTTLEAFARQAAG